MNLLTAIKIAGSGLKVQKLRLNVAATNIANAEVTRNTSTLSGAINLKLMTVFRTIG